MPEPWPQHRPDDGALGPQGVQLDVTSPSELPKTSKVSALSIRSVMAVFDDAVIDAPAAPQYYHHRVHHGRINLFRQLHHKLTCAGGHTTCHNHRGACVYNFRRTLN